MPDQSSAATEHAILQEITGPLETLPDDPLAAVAADFPTTLRGYDRMAVDEYVQQTRRLVAELQVTRSPESAVRRALERVGDQITGVLQRAHDTAEQITAQSRREAEDRLQQVRAEARQIATAAEDRVKELDADTDRIWLERQRIVADAEDLAGQLLALAKVAAERFPTDEDADAAPYDEAAHFEEAALYDEAGSADDEAASHHESPPPGEAGPSRAAGSSAEAGSADADAALTLGLPIEAGAPEQGPLEADDGPEEDIAPTVAFRPLTRKPHHDPAELADDPAVLADDPAVLADDPAVLADDPAVLADDPAELANDPAELANDPAELANDPAPLAADDATEVGDDETAVLPVVEAGPSPSGGAAPADAGAVRRESGRATDNESTRVIRPASQAANRRLGR